MICMLANVFMLVFSSSRISLRAPIGYYQVMAKKKRRPLRDQDPKSARDQAPTSTRDITILRPAHVAQRKRPALKTSETLSVEHSNTTLGDRFNVLPAELRAHIFSFLLARPVKWDVEHQPKCPRRQSDYDITPTMRSSNQCSVDASMVEWRKGNCDIFQSPWRSQWAAEQQNPYVCSVCYDHRLRGRPTPTPRTLPCLCARRQELQLLLVCKKWYQEAGTVLYTQNTWAFEDDTTFTSFIPSLNPDWRTTISKVSLMSWVKGTELYPTSASTLFMSCHGLPYDTTWEEFLQRPEYTGPGIWALLRTLPALSHLELDALFLTSARTVKLMLKLGLRNLKQVKFVRRVEDVDNVWKSGTPTVWPAFAGRELIVGGFAEEVARAIKGQRQLRLKKFSAIKESVDQMQFELIKPRSD
ncbi:hypothetical protein AC578_8254 [Pseudocercospora eumusae]|uniref:DUF7730 domain-containing protein n=1 Tax=Pseudocercospora eumusae TaxID=321146 RepID=A0A139HE31_9PEZI|nr:hypothetical protein AC578_8254 [Pseudocercospora eumusae]